MREVGLPKPPKPTLIEALRGIISDRQVDAALATRAVVEYDRFLSLLVKAVPKVQTFQLTINPTSCSANTTNAQTFTCSGLTTRDIVKVNKPSHTAGLTIANAFVGTDDILTIVFGNLTGSPIDPPSETYLVESTRI